MFAIKLFDTKSVRHLSIVQSTYLDILFDYTLLSLIAI